MSAVWRAARAAVRRRRLQTIVIGLVVLFATVSIVMALGLLEAASAPFDQAFAKQRGAHVVATYDATRVSDAQLAQAALQPGVEATAGPFRQATLDATVGGIPGGGGPLRVVGRAQPAGLVDGVDVWAGRWVTGPGEIVLNMPYPVRSVFALGQDDPPPHILGMRIEVPSGPTLTVVGVAYSLSDTADAWVSPEQIAALAPTATQMLYRFTSSATSTDVSAGLASVAAGLPQGSLVASASYLVIKRAIAARPGVYTPFLMVFGVLGLLVAVLIVANVVSGAVVSGFRHIGVLKSLGFTPRQVVAVYLVMVLVPAAVGSVLGTVAGNVAAQPLLSTAFEGMGLGGVGISAWVDVAALLGMPAIVGLAALVPALRAHRLSAVEAVSAGSAPRTGRGLRVQRSLSGTRLPRSVSLGLGLPFTRPGRTALTLAAVLLGVTTATFTTGLADTVTRYAKALDTSDIFQVIVQPGGRHSGPRPGGPAPGGARPDQVDPALGDAETEALLRSLPGATRVTARLSLPVSLVEYSGAVEGEFLRGDSSTLGYRKQLARGRWFDKPGEIVVTSAFLKQRGLAVGDRVTLTTDGRQTNVAIVGATMSTDDKSFYAGWDTLTALTPDFAPNQLQYLVTLAPTTDPVTYLEAVKEANPGLFVGDASEQESEFTVIMVSLSLALTLMLGTVAALGVFNTVVLSARERRRDLGMLKSIGMTPRQVTVMMVTSMAVLGAVGGLFGVPLGILAHREIVPLATEAARIDIPNALLQVWHTSSLGLLVLSGIAIAILGALIPARSAARLPIAQVLHNE